ncbi:AAA family ATPase [Paenibacillus sp. CGMCC 1.16610]|nr:MULTISPECIES: AAA family ATPase [Paenibacillus]MBA2941052.1 AAA family ATPase [Paenibacillus sp. CGMCC 1.16610]
MLRIKKIKVKNFRKFHNTDLQMDATLTAIAGSNNAGKTSIVELMSSIFTPGKSLSVEDISYSARKDDIQRIQSIFNDESISDDEKLERLLEVYSFLNKITVLVSIEYDDDDNLHLFSDYLSDYDPQKKNYYFIIEFEYKIAKLKEIQDVIIKNKNVEELFSSLESIIYYCDENGEDRIKIKNKDVFYNLFNFHCVYALRRLSDTSEEKQSFLSKRLLKTVENNERWSNGLDKLVEDINELLIEKDLSSQMDALTIDTIKQTLFEFSKTNGGNTGKLGIDFRLENQDIHKVILEFSKIYFEQDGGGKIKEQKQGLGYSNLIYLLLETQIFKDKMDSAKVNLLVFEEPEAHLHPQMENIFIQYLNRINGSEESKEANHLTALTAISSSYNLISSYNFDVYNEVATASSMEEVNKEKPQLFQLFITTHSSEMAKLIKLSRVRVIRPQSHIESSVFDLEQFLIGLEPDEVQFYNKFFQFNMIEMIFADKVILFEGDAERLLIKYLVATDKNYRSLASQYISYIQVGGAYAHNYLKIIKYLKIKTLLLSDLDYEYEDDDLKKEALSLIGEVHLREVSNQTIITITGHKIVKDIYNFQISKKGVFDANNLICLKFQTFKDGYARTLEDAILVNLFDKRTVFTKVTREEMNSLIQTNKLCLAGSKGSITSIRDRIAKLSKKTDFMYSLLENERLSKAIPKYIEEGLIWLQA